MEKKIERLNTLQERNRKIDADIKALRAKFTHDTVMLEASKGLFVEEMDLLEKQIMLFMLENNTKEEEAGQIKACLKEKARKIDIVKGYVFEEKFLTTKTDTKPNKVAIKKALLAGEEIYGAKISDAEYEIKIKRIK